VKQKEARFQSILESHRGSIYRICWGFTSSNEDVQDLFQEVMMNIWRGLDRFRGQSELATWVYRISVNTCLLWKRSKKRRISLSSGEDRIPEQGGKTVEQDFIRSEKIIQLKEAIASLKKIDRTIALLLLEEMSYKEIAEITGLTVNNVGVKINRIKTELKKKLQ